jgi:DNA-binding GntR family transcriptional regulator
MPSRRRESDREHLKIVVAIERRDADEAERAARLHIQQAQRTRFENTVE